MQALFGVTEQHQNSEEEVEKEEKLSWFPLLLIDQVTDWNSRKKNLFCFG